MIKDQNGSLLQFNRVFSDWYYGLKNMQIKLILLILFSSTLFCISCGLSNFNKPLKTIPIERTSDFKLCSVLKQNDKKVKDEILKRNLLSERNINKVNALTKKDINIGMCKCLMLAIAEEGNCDLISQYIDKEESVNEIWKISIYENEEIIDNSKMISISYNIIYVKNSTIVSIENKSERFLENLYGDGKLMDLLNTPSCLNCFF